MIISLPLLPSNSSPCSPSSQLHLKFMGPHSLIYMRVHVCVCVWIWILYVYVFRAGHLGLDNHLRGSSLGKTTFLCQQPLIAYSSSPGHGGPWNFPTLVQILFKQPYCWDSMGIASLSHLEDTILQQTFWFLWFLQSFCPLLFRVPWALG